MSKDAANKALMLSVMAAFREGDLEPLFAAVSPQVVWTSGAPRELFRFGGTHHGIPGVKEFTALFFSRYHVTRLEPKTVTAKGDQVWALFDAEARHHPSGRLIQCDLTLHWILHEGKVMTHQGFFDTASMLIQQGELAA